MEISVSQEQGHVPITVFELDGVLNIGTAEQLESQGRSAYATGARYLLIDMSRLSSLSSAGLRSILSLSQLFVSETPISTSGEKNSPGHKHTNFKLLNPNQPIEKVLAISGFTGFLEVYRDRQEAIDSFA